MNHLLLIFVVMFAGLAFSQAAVAEGPGTYVCSATADQNAPGSLTVSSNGGQINNVAVKLNNVLLTEGTDYLKTLNGSQVTITFLCYVKKDDSVTLTGQCATSGTHDGTVASSSTGWSQA